MSNKEERDAEKRRRIVEAARARFRHYGIRKTTMQEIAADAGVAVGALYLYFANKDALGIACTEDFIQRHRDQADAIFASEAPASKKLIDYFVVRFREAKETRTSSKHAAELAREVLRLKPDRLQEEGVMMWQVVVRILGEGVAAGELAVENVEHDAMILLYSTAYFFPNALMQMPQYPTEDQLLEVLQWFLGVWRRDAIPKPPRRTKTAKAKSL